jgi:hypothetical protein
MNFDDQLRGYFGTTDLAAVPASTLQAGIERMKVDLGLQGDRSTRFALWVLLHGLSEAPDLEAVFPDAADRDAARDLMELLEQASVDPQRS